MQIVTSLVIAFQVNPAVLEGCEKRGIVGICSAFQSGCGHCMESVKCTSMDSGHLGIFVTL